VALLRCDFSEVLEVGTSMSVLLHQASESQIGVSTSSTDRNSSTAGEHEWGLWDATIRDVLAWLPLAR